MDKKTLNSCFEILKTAKTDNERFASLLMVAKLIKAENTDSESRRQIFDAIGFKFINRLLRSGSVPDGCSAYAYKSVALAILACFCSDADLVVHDDMLANLPAIARIISSTDKDDIDAEPIINDSYVCLTCIASHHDGISALIKHCVVEALCKAVAFWNQGWPKAHQLLMYIINTQGSAAWVGNTAGLQYLLNKFAKDFAEKTDESQFGVCSTIYIVLSTTEQSQVATLQHETWSSKIQDVLERILRSKISSRQRDPALKLACLLVDLLGVTWAVGTSRQKWLLLVVHLACIEVRMSLEGQSLEQIESCGTIVTCCYLLLENTISYMICGPSLALDSKQLHQLHCAMVGAFNAVLHFLREHQDIASQPAIVLASVRALGAWIAEETTALNAEVVELLPFLLDIGKTSFHQFKTYLASHQTATTKCDDNNDSHNDDDDDDEPPAEILKFLLPGLCHLSAEEKARQIIIDHRVHELLAEYLNFLWHNYSCLDTVAKQSLPSNTHDSESQDGIENKMDSLTVRTDERVHNQRVMCIYSETELEKGLTTLCGVLLNLVVLEVDLVKSHVMFSELHSFAVNNLPQLADNDEKLVLCYNMMTLSLLLSRHLVEKQRSVSTAEFFSRCISLLSRVHCVSGSGENVCLAIADTHTSYWDDCAELWFLSMQALCECISLYKCLPQLILRSGWIPALCKLLTQLKGDSVNAEVVTCYSSLLCQCAQHDSDAKQVIIEKGGERISRTYKMEQLQEVLKS